MTQRAIPDDFDAVLTELCEAARFLGGEEAGYRLANTKQREVDAASSEYYELLAAFREKFNPTGAE